MVERRDGFERSGDIGEVGESIKSFDDLRFIYRVHCKYCNKSLIYNRNLLSQISKFFF